MMEPDALKTALKNEQDINAPEKQMEQMPYI